MNYILVVEDDRVQRGNLLKFMSKQFDGEYEILSASSGKEAIDLAIKYQFRIKLILLDIVLPDISGNELYNRIRSNLFFIMPPTIVITANDQPDQMVETIIGRSIDNYIVKPYALGELNLAAEKALKRKMEINNSFSKEFFIQTLIEKRNAYLLNWQRENAQSYSFTAILDQLVRVDNFRADVDSLKSLLHVFESDSGIKVNDPWSPNILFATGNSSANEKLKPLFKESNPAVSYQKSYFQLQEEIAQKRGFDILVLDLSLPGLKETDLFQFLKSHKKPKNEIIVFSDFKGDLFLRKLSSCGVDKFINRTFGVGKLIEEIEHSFYCLYCMREMEEHVETILELKEPLFVKKRG